MLDETAKWFYIASQGMIKLIISSTVEVFFSTCPTPPHNCKVMTCSYVSLPTLVKHLRLINLEQIQLIGSEL